MKKTILWITLIVLFSGIISFCSSCSSSCSEDVTSVTSSTTPKNSFNESLTIVDLTDQVLVGEFMELNQISYLGEDTLYLVVSSSNQSKLISLDTNSNKTEDLLVEDSILHADIFRDKVYLFQDHQTIEYVFSTRNKTMWELPDNLILAKGHILPSDRKMVYPEDHQLLLIPLSNVSEQKAIKLPDDLSALLVEPLSDDLFYVATRKGEKGQTVLILDNNGVIKYQSAFDAVYPVQWEKGLLLTGGIDDQSGSLYLIDSETGNTQKLLTPNEAETATISFNGQWILTATYQEETNAIKLSLYKTNEEIFYEYIISDDDFSGIVNFTNGSDSLFVSDDGFTGGIHFLDDEGFRFLKLDFLHKSECKKDFDLVSIEQ